MRHNSRGFLNNLAIFLHNFKKRSSHICKTVFYKFTQILTHISNSNNILLITAGAVFKYVLKNVILGKQIMQQKTETRVCKFSGPDSSVTL